VPAAAPAPPSDRRAQRHAGTRSQILAAAADLVRSEGLASLSMRDLGARVGMRAQSVYGYFPSKHAIYDALFQQGAEAFLAAMSAPTSSEAAEPHERLMASAQRFFTFCVSDPVRYQLLFLHTIPGFVPSPEAYEPAVAALALTSTAFAEAGITDPDALDLATAVLAGLTSQQLANDPGGDRWARLVDRAVLMLLTDFAPHVLTAPPTITDRKATR